MTNVNRLQLSQALYLSNHLAYCLHRSLRFHHEYVNVFTVKRTGPPANSAGTDLYKKTRLLYSARTGKRQAIEHQYINITLLMQASLEENNHAKLLIGQLFVSRDESSINSFCG